MTTLFVSSFVPSVATPACPFRGKENPCRRRDKGSYSQMFDGSGNDEPKRMI
jgi:hypothetical protein